MADQVKKVAEQQLFSAEEAEQLTGIKKWQVSRWGTRLEEPEKYRAMLYGAAYAKAMAEAEHNRATANSGDNEWYTPAEYIEAARHVLGEIDLDPASCDKAQELVKAARYFTKRDNGLEREWQGRVWLNPPYAQPSITHFVAKMVMERAAGRVEAAIMLTNNSADTAWFHEAAKTTDAICFTRGRVQFYKAAGGPSAPLQGQAFFYFGDDVETFTLRFQEIGFVVVPA